MSSLCVSNTIFVCRKESQDNRKWRKCNKICIHRAAPNKLFWVSARHGTYDSERALKGVKERKGLLEPRTETKSSHTTGIVPMKGLGIVDFLKGKNFLVTGATGFVAKVLIENILRVQPDVGKLFLVIKAKDSSTALKRLKNEVVNMELFKVLQENYGDEYENFILQKLVPVVGDMTQDNLGLQADMTDILINQVDIIVSSGANTTFDERYDVALETNTMGVSRLVEFGKRCKRVQLLMHLSTAYANGQIEGPALERLFQTGVSLAKGQGKSSSLLDIESEFNLAKEILEGSQTEFADLQKFNSISVADSAKKLTQRMRDLGIARARRYGWQDSYCLTKAMGEMLIVNGRGDLPVVIVRPSIIESTYNNPFPGWIQGNRMFDPIISYYGKGQLVGLFGDPDTIIDLVPVDMVVNATLAAMAKHAGKSEVQVYHVASSTANPSRLQDLVEAIYDHFSSNPYIDNKGRPVELQKEPAFFASMEDFCRHAWKNAFNTPISITGLPSFTANISEREKKNRIKCIEQIIHMYKLYEPYLFFKGRFDVSNLEILFRELSNEEQKTFGFNVKTIDWKEYITNIHIPGLRHYVMKGRGIGLKGLAKVSYN